jgi:hypothetical protein
MTVFTDRSLNLLLSIIQGNIESLYGKKIVSTAPFMLHRVSPLADIILPNNIVAYAVYLNALTDDIEKEPSVEFEWKKGEGVRLLKGSINANFATTTYWEPLNVFEQFLFQEVKNFVNISFFNVYGWDFTLET